MGAQVVAGGWRDCVAARLGLAPGLKKGGAPDPSGRAAWLGSNGAYGWFLRITGR